MVPVPASSERAYLDALLDVVWRNRPFVRALENRGPHAYRVNDASQFWIAELARRVAAATPGVDAGYLDHAVFTALRVDVSDYLVTNHGMTPTTSGADSAPSPRLQPQLEDIRAVLQA